MSKRTLNLTEPLYKYLLSVSLRETDVMKALREETRRLPMAMMQISPEQGQFMRLLIKLMGAQRAIEVGTFTGYSALAVASALPDDGKLICCDIDRDWTSIARRYWRKAGVDHKIDLHLAPALETLQGLVESGQQGRIDFAFIDADKENYLKYYEQCLTLIRPGGLIAIDNTLWDGDVINQSNQTPETVAIRTFNQAIAKDVRVEISLLPIADGLTLARKR
ncbi:MAG TPA: SAM-dependent methyltransferase [Gammaproteobacteria bacterium]|nr:SAM-dependent methyltransferase [Gammaproteobacteria bacterium]